MPRSMQVIDAVSPHGVAGKDIELRAACAFGKDSGTKADPSFEHQCVIAAHLPGEGTQRNGARDVGGAIEILTARVDEQEPFRQNGDVSLGSGGVMDDGTMMCVAHNALKTDALE